MTQNSRFRALLQRDGMIIAPGAYDCITAKLIEQAGFAAGDGLVRRSVVAGWVPPKTTSPGRP